MQLNVESSGGSSSGVSSTLVVSLLALTVAALGLGFALEAWTGVRSFPVVYGWSEEGRRSRSTACPYGSINFVQCEDANRNGVCDVGERVLISQEFCNPGSIALVLERVDNEVKHMKEDPPEQSAHDNVQDAQITLLDRGGEALMGNYTGLSGRTTVLESELDTEVGLREAQFDALLDSNVVQDVRLGHLELEQSIQRSMLANATDAIWYNATVTAHLLEADVEELWVVYNATRDAVRLLDSAIWATRHNASLSALLGVARDDAIAVLTQQGVDLQAVMSSLSFDTSVMGGTITQLVAANATQWDTIFSILGRLDVIQVTTASSGAVFSGMMQAIQGSLVGLDARVTALQTPLNATIEELSLLSALTGRLHTAELALGAIQARLSVVVDATLVAARNATTTMFIRAFQRIAGAEVAQNVLEDRITGTEGDAALLQTHVGVLHGNYAQTSAALSLFEDAQVAHDVRLVYLEGNYTAVLAHNQTLEDTRLDVDVIKSTMESHAATDEWHGTRLGELQTRADAADSLFVVVCGKADANEARYVNLTQTVVYLDAHHADTRINLGALMGRIDAVEAMGQIIDAELNATVLSVMAGAMTVMEDVLGLHNETLALREDVAGVKGDVNELQVGAAGTIVALQAHSGAVAMLQNATNAHSAQLQDIQSTMATSGAILGVLQGSVSDAQTRITALEDEAGDGGGNNGQLQKTYESRIGVCASGTANADGTAQWVLGGSTTRTANGRYTIVLNVAAAHSHYPVFIQVHEPDTVDRVIVRENAKTTLGFSIETRKKNGSGTKNYIDASFSWSILCEQQVLVDVVMAQQ